MVNDHKTEASIRISCCVIVERQCDRVPVLLLILYTVTSLPVRSFSLCFR
jgi:hypothetical protein